MKIGIIGSGMIGGTAARLFARAGHEVAISNSRGREAVAGIAREIGMNAHAMEAEQAAAFGDIVLLAIPLHAFNKLPPGWLQGKIAIDAMNYYPDRDGRIDALDSGRSTSSELVAQHFPGARVVKAFNTIYYKNLAARGDAKQPVADRFAIFVAGDDPEAKALVTGLIEELGFAPVDTGSLREGGRKQQPGSPIYNQVMTGREGAEAQKGI